MRQFAEEEIVIPSGTRQGMRYDAEVQPFNRLWFDALDSGNWRRFAATGPSQSSKTLIGSNIPVAYHLFERRDDVIYAVPNLDMVADKWQNDLLPIIANTRYAEHIPERGAGSRGGTPTLIQFTNGAKLRFMTGGGRDKSRAGYTARVLVVTEVDEFDEPGLTSREGSKVEQLRARLRSYTEQTGTPSVEYYECTASLETGYIWQTRASGTGSRIALCCPNCREWIVPPEDASERKLVDGWGEAENVLQARELARWVCPLCGGSFNEQQRRGMNEEAVLCHRGQTLDRSGRVSGEMPASDLFSFRWSAINNLFRSAADVGEEEWLADKVTPSKRDAEERKLNQFTWALPDRIEIIEPEIQLDQDELAKRLHNTPRGLVPEGTVTLVCHVDIHKAHGDWMVLAQKSDGSATVVDYAVFSIEGHALGIVRAIPKALHDFASRMRGGLAAEGGGRRDLDQIWIDSGWGDSTQIVYGFVREINRAWGAPYGTGVWRAAVGRGAGQHLRMRPYTRPKKTSQAVWYIGEQCHIVRLTRDSCDLVEVNSDYWKTVAHERLAMETDEPGSIRFFAGASDEHKEVIEQITAEHRERQPKRTARGIEEVVVWVRDSRNNHALDNLYSCCCAAAYCVDTGTVQGRRTRRKHQSSGWSVPVLTRPDGTTYGLPVR